MLWSIWAASLVLAAMSLVAMAGLIVSRLLSLGKARRLAEHREKLVAGLLAWLEGEAAEWDVGKLLAREKALAIDVLIELFENMRGDEQGKLAALADRVGLTAHIHRILRKGRIRDRLVAAECLTWFPSEATVNALRKALDDKSLDVSLAAAASLMDLSPDVPLEDMLAGRLDRRDSSRRLEDLLGRAARRDPERLLRVAEDEARTDRVRAAALEALAQAGASDFLERIVTLEQSQSVDVRAAVARCLGAIGHPSCEPVIGRMLADPAWQVRVRAADAAGTLGSLALGELLCVLIEDPNWWVRLRSAEALAKLGDVGIGWLKDIVASETNIASAQTAALVLAERRNVA